jgi:hypothetical protein
MGSELLNSLAPIRSLGDQSHIGISTEERGYALPDQNMIIDRENPDLS